jgi:hypothetical protein
VDHAREAGAEAEQRVRGVRVAPALEDVEHGVAPSSDVLVDVVVDEVVVADGDAEDEHVGVARATVCLRGESFALLGGGVGRKDEVGARRHAGGRVGVAALHLLGPHVQAELLRLG